SEAGKESSKAPTIPSEPAANAKAQPSASKAIQRLGSPTEQRDVKLGNVSPSFKAKPAVADAAVSSEAPQLTRRVAGVDKTKQPAQELALAQLQSPPAVALPPAGTVITPAAKPGGSQIITQVAAVQAPKYSGETFNLELKDADLKDFFHLIGDF